MTDAKDTTPATRRKPIDRAAYRDALDRAAASLPWADPAVLDRLRRDVDGKAIAALNRLRATDIEQAYCVLFAVVQSAGMALNSPTIVTDLADRVTKYSDAAAKISEVLELNKIPHLSLPDSSTRALTDLIEYFTKTAHSYENMPLKAGITRKPDAAIITLRQLRHRLFRDRRAPHLPLLHLAEAALGIEIPPDTMKSALRSLR